MPGAILLVLPASLAHHHLVHGPKNGIIEAPVGCSTPFIAEKYQLIPITKHEFREALKSGLFIFFAVLLYKDLDHFGGCCIH